MVDDKTISIFHISKECTLQLVHGRVRPRSSTRATGNSRNYVAQARAVRGHEQGNEHEHLFADSMKGHESLLERVPHSQVLIDNHPSAPQIDVREGYSCK